MGDNVEKQSDCSGGVGVVRTINPGVLHLQKLGLELKCSLCLDFFKRPCLLPCNHMFCQACLTSCAQFATDCPVCNKRYYHPDVRALDFVENIVAMYRSLDASLSANLNHCTSSGSTRFLEQSPASASNCNVSGRVSLVRSIDDRVRKNALRVKSCEPTQWEQNRQALVASGYYRNYAGPSADPPQSDGVLDHTQKSIDSSDELTPPSPPSFGDHKDSENDTSDQGVDVSSKKLHSAKLIKRPADAGANQEGHGCLVPEAEEGRLRESKRQKRIDYDPPVLGSDGIFSQSSMAPESGEQPSGMPDSLFSVKAVCGFCQFSNVSKETGPMLHLANGKSVDGERAAAPDVLHVHRTCIDWAPQVYYVGETVKNLKAEMARGAKLKCTGCGLKGAALGCYLKSCRRTYHAPCAMQIDKCRFDDEEFLMLCPAHSSIKFPSEKKSKKHKPKDSRLSSQIVPKQPNFWAGSPSGPKEWVLCGSALSPEERYTLVKFGSVVGVPVSKLWKPNVTHVIAATDENGACTRTLKVLMAILNGRWVLTIDWIKECMESMHPVDEEPYEINLDNHGTQDGPKSGRISVLNNAPNLFSGLYFYFCGDFISGYKEDLKNLVAAAGGNILENEELVLSHCNDEAAPSKPLLVYNFDPPEGCKLEEEVSIIWQRLSAAQDLAARTGSQVIGHIWLLESIAAYKLQPLVTANLLV